MVWQLVEHCATDFPLELGFVGRAELRRPTGGAAGLLSKFFESVRRFSNTSNRDSGDAYFVASGKNGDGAFDDCFPDGRISEIRRSRIGLSRFEAFADAEDVAVGVAEVHFADVPRFVDGRHGHI